MSFSSSASRSRANPTPTKQSIHHNKSSTSTTTCNKPRTTNNDSTSSTANPNKSYISKQVTGLMNKMGLNDNNKQQNSNMARNKPINKENIPNNVQRAVNNNSADPFHINSSFTPGNNKPLSNDTGTTRRRLSVASNDINETKIIDGSTTNDINNKSTNSNNHQLDGSALSPATRSRRKLSVMGDLSLMQQQSIIDGTSTNIHDQANNIVASKSPQISPRNLKLQSNTNSSVSQPYHSYASLSKTGFVPFNPNKVNQDRCVEVVKFQHDDNKAVFGVFDGHGAIGHIVSEFVKNDLHRCIASQSDLDTNPHQALTQAFIECHQRLVSSGIDCQFSGTTVVLVYINGNSIYTCNAGDSRAILCQSSYNNMNKLQYKTIALSNDHKPDVESEKQRILQNNGRVEACHGTHGESIGPLRVWLQSHDVPGLAMTRSFGDLCAQSVGVSHIPEIIQHTINRDTDKFIIIGSDGIFEFLSNDDICQLATTQSTPEFICKKLVDEATHKWHMEEEVVDDCSVIYIAL